MGHSTLSGDAFLELLQAHEVEAVADIRRYPGSQRHPQFNQSTLAPTLAAVDIEYRRFVDLGGRRSARIDPSPNGGWRSASFAAYADHLLTPSGLSALEELIAWGGGRRFAFMCAEVTHLRCHRQIVADWLLAREVPVLHAQPDREPVTHRLAALARVDEHGQVTYPADELA